MFLIFKCWCYELVFNFSERFVASTKYSGKLSILQTVITVEILNSRIVYFLYLILFYKIINLDDYQYLEMYCIIQKEV